jgi:hypothetical protein
VTVTACAQVATDDVRVSVARSGAADATSQYVAYDLEVTQDIPFQIDVLCEGTDIIRARSLGGNVSFTVNGYADDIPTS